ncbi:MAG TPA: dihydropteroate synthase [Thermoleophilaceae bacterium]|nr:dihydropteroate synthase [Thermoleophilaceae bacterium]
MTRLVLRGRELAPGPARPLIMGIVNASPESFSDGAEVGGLEQQVELALSMRDEGADLIDVGGESGVTDRPAVDAATEAARVVPLVERLAAEDVVVSIDTWKADVAREALAAGAALVNDVSGLRDPGLAAECAAAGAGLVVTHTRAEPKRKVFPRYEDVVEDVVGFLADRMAAAREAGVGEEALIVDPGPDLAKLPAETIALVRSLPRIAALGRPVLLALSRKDFVGALTGRAPRDRLAGTLAAIGAGLDGGGSILRVHDVAAVADFVAVRSALRGDTEVPPELRLDPGLRRAV